MKTKLICSLTNVVWAAPVIITAAIFITCSSANQMHLQKTSSGKPSDSLLVDNNGNRYSVKILRDNNLWMTANLKLNILGSYCYGNTEENCERYGRLYTWESAIKGCSLLGEGWRLPVRDEWQRLTILYGGVAEDSNVTRKEAYTSLL